MKLPPHNMPPTQSPQKKDGDWDDDVLADRPSHGMSVDAARRVLEMNPAMREHGADTGFLVNQAERAHLAAKGMIKKAEAPATAPFSDVRDVDHLLSAAQQRFEQEKRELEVQLSLIQTKLSGMKERHLGEVMDKLAELDANLSSMITQSALHNYKRFTEVLGFTPQKFIERMRSKRR